MLRFERSNYCDVIENIYASIQGAKAGLMGKQLRNRDFFFAGLRKLWPKLGDPSINVDLMFLQGVQGTRAANSFCRRPDENERVLAPRFLAACVLKSTVKIDNRFPILPDRNSGAQLRELLEVLEEQRFQSLKKFVRTQMHRPNGRDAALRRPEYPRRPRSFDLWRDANFRAFL